MLGMLLEQFDAAIALDEMCGAAFSMAGFASRATNGVQRTRRATSQWKTPERPSVCPEASPPPKGAVRGWFLDVDSRYSDYL